MTAFILPIFGISTTTLIGNLFVFVELAIVSVVVWQQWVRFTETRNQIAEFMEAMPETESLILKNHYLLASTLKAASPTAILKNIKKYSFSDMVILPPNSGDSVEKVALITEHTEHEDLFCKIRDSINTYLLRNKGGVADFNLVKDIVERNTNALEHDINIGLPAPLYLGLMGTMVGIVVGLVIFVAKVSSPGLDTEGGQMNDYMSGINELLIGVCVGMFASAFGLGLTVYNSILKFKGAKSVVEARKNDFYTFIQTELLPILSQNLNTGFHNLQMNLTNFNNEFSGNLQELKALMSDNNKALIAQSNIIDKLEDVDLNAFVKANVTIFSELKGSIESLRQFGLYVNLLNKFVEQSSGLNNKVLELLQRSDNLETIAQQVSANLEENKKLTMFLNAHFNVLEDHSQVINDSVGKIDNLMSKSFSDLRENISSNVNTLVNFSHQERDKLSEVMRENRTSLTNLQYLESLSRHVHDMKKNFESNNVHFQTKLVDLVAQLNQQMVTMNNEKKQGNGLVGFIRSTISEIRELF
jgi:hypothetical protein